MKKIGLFVVLAATLSSAVPALAQEYRPYNYERDREAREARERREHERRERQERLQRARDLIIDAENRIQSEQGLMGTIRVNIATEQDNAAYLDMRARKFDQKYSDMSAGCMTAEDQEECTALAGAEKQLADKYHLDLQSSRDRIAGMQADLALHQGSIDALLAQRDNARAEKDRIEAELREPKHVVTVGVSTSPGPRPVIVVPAR